VCITLSDAAPWSLNQFPTIRLFGVTCAQGCLYFSWHSQDSTQLKSIVSSVNRLRIMKLADCRRLLPYCQAISFFFLASHLIRYCCRLLETFHVALVAHAIFVYTISNHGDLNRLNNAVWWDRLYLILASSFLSWRPCHQEYPGMSFWCICSTNSPQPRAEDTSSTVGTFLSSVISM
jgi:hypothetical protein